MPFGLTGLAIKAIEGVFANFQHIEKVILYGSRAIGNYRSGSDIDITLQGDDISLNNTVYLLMDELDELYLPYTFDVSIYGRIKNRDLLEHIARVGKVLFKRQTG